MRVLSLISAARLPSVRSLPANRLSKSGSGMRFAKVLFRSSQKSTILNIQLNRGILPSTGKRTFASAAVAESKEPTTDSTKPIGEPQHYEFKAETKKLLQIVANSLYSDREVFCRELISNAADALEKRRHEELVSDSSCVGSENGELAVKITVDKEKGQLIFEDSGIGMTKEELIDLLGTIARSGMPEGHLGTRSFTCLIRIEILCGESIVVQ